ncbi:hypothetical protein OG874_00155 [Nocardia sp. NBC_00565]|uniref:hypothetical protein n=1 Tax=Nocardia sp. NBC_00565 TaxID=2975993 RepID=UPI002E8097A2|nr:hypothetical protein [Nocardia sp. NBC_00565]WUC03666.1 hypothetical protein OG874_00155 [Nocardia sp. NBC_00565]
MTVHPSAKNLAKDIARQMWPKVQPRRKRASKTARRAPEGFSKPVKALMFVRAGGRCEIDDCGPIEHWHHRGARSLGGTKAPWVNRAANGLGLAAACHEHVEAYRTNAYRNGWLVSRNGTQTAVDVPVLYRGRLVLLDDAGGIRPIEGRAA